MVQPSCCASGRLDLLSTPHRWPHHHARFNFVGKYYFHHFGADPDSRDRWRDHEFFNETARWCEDYDQASFDPVYPSLPLSFFAPMVGRILAKPAYWWAPAHPKKMAVTGA